MDPADLAERWWLLDAIERDVRSSAGRVAQNDPAVLGRFSRHVTERRRPEREHLLEPSAADDDRADPDLLSRCVRRPGAHAQTVTQPSLRGFGAKVCAVRSRTTRTTLARAPDTDA